MTAKQEAVLRCIETYIRENGCPPTVRDICAATGLKSTATVHGYIKRLQEQGYLKKAENKKRTLLPANAQKPSAVPVPIVGTVTAGMPILAIENLDGYFPVSEEIARGRDLFILKVKGESMIGAGIFDGDRILVQKQSTAENGQIVVAFWDDSATVKRFFKEDGRYRLQPENDAMEPIYTDVVTILGIVVGLFREL